jgi:hypothetical protein
MTGDKHVITSFVELRSRTDHPGVRVERWPDEENRDSSDIDAIAGRLAIEHTSVDSVPNQRRDSAWFMQVVEPLERAFRTGVSFRLQIVFEYDAVAAGQDWHSMRRSLATWIQGEAQTLQDGRHVIRLPNFPFPFDAIKTSTRKPKLVFSRYAPDGDSLAERLNVQVKRKAEKLDRYQRGGYVTVLLLESSDIALTSEGTLLAALRDGLPTGVPAVVNEVWYADTSIPEAETEFSNFTKLLRFSSELAG